MADRKRLYKVPVETYTFCGNQVEIWEELAAVGEGATVWESGETMSKYLEQSGLDLEDKEVLELGSGTGLVSIVASLMGAKVTATDLGDVLCCTKGNIPRNTEDKVKHRPVIRRLEWGSDDLHGFIPQYDYVLGADIVYIKRTFPELMRTIMHVCGPQTTLILANKFRWYTDGEFYEKVLSKKFDVEEILYDEENKVKVFRCKKKAEED
ncbi:METTL21A [Branchiostoma lanceolatum]|uniref:METTL21A protein n=1 Tax=Branchiostoma lanceolatum TaxID=7740 RepID=A0A8J9YXB9_BRALA|nr:METTL21A [Branchiostoma lanceolatum]